MSIYRALIAITAVALALMVSWGSAAKPVKKAGNDLVKRGEYLVTLAGCADCHTPMVFDRELNMPVPDSSRRFAGHPAGAPDPQGTLGQGDQALFGPTSTAVRLSFGVVYASNLTPDQQTGLGGWKEADFIKTMRTGKHLGEGRQILPPMPWMSFARMPDDDLKAIYAYLRSIPAISNSVPEPKVDPKALDAITKSFAKMAGASK